MPFEDRLGGFGKFSLEKKKTKAEHGIHVQVLSVS